MIAIAFFEMNPEKRFSTWFLISSTLKNESVSSVTTRSHAPLQETSHFALLFFFSFSISEFSFSEVICWKQRNILNATMPSFARLIAVWY